jgi:poly-gamma-glutamate synthase PgsB/CapB
MMRWWRPTGSGKNAVRRVLVTGSRGKSSIVRLLHAAFADAGLTAYARITGVAPRELGPGKIRPISRSAGAHVGEMRWWLGQLPATAQAIVLENSAVSPDLQALAGRWLQPDITVLSNTLPDHQEIWGATSADAAEVLAAGIPINGQVILPDVLEGDNHLRDLLQQRKCVTFFASPAPGVEIPYQAGNLGLALAVIQQLGLDAEAARRAMLGLPADSYDFRILDCNGAQLAMAFSANDIASTRMLFASLQWSETETRLLYNHRADRPARLRSFLRWFEESAWRDVLIIGDRPFCRVASARYLKISNRAALLRLFQAGERVFGCGNIAGLPMMLASE